MRILTLLLILTSVITSNPLQAAPPETASPQTAEKPVRFHWEKPRKAPSFLTRVMAPKEKLPRLLPGPSGLLPETLPQKLRDEALRGRRTALPGELIERSHQYVRSAKIVGSWQQIIRSDKGELLYATGAALPQIPTELEAKIAKMENGRDRILDLAKQRLPLLAQAPLITTPRIEVVYHEGTHTYRPEWVIEYVAASETSAWRARFSEKLELIRNENAGAELADGQATVFPSGPKASQLSPVTLPAMIGDGSLANPLLKVISALDPQAWAPNLVFRYGVGDTRFDEVQVYFYIDRAIHWFSDVTGAQIAAPLEVKVHVGQNGKSNAAFYFKKKIFLGTGDGVIYQDMLKDPSVVIHECAHAFIEDLAGLPTQGEGGALNEGFADFFAASILDNPNVGEASYLQGPYRRTLNNDLKAFRDFSDGVYRNGTIVAATLWDIRKALGIEKAARIATHALARLGEGGKFDDFAQAVLSTVDTRPNPNDYQVVESILTERGWRTRQAIRSADFE